MCFLRDAHRLKQQEAMVRHPGVNGAAPKSTQRPKSTERPSILRDQVHPRDQAHPETKHHLRTNLFGALWGKPSEQSLQHKPLCALCSLKMVMIMIMQDGPPAHCNHKTFHNAAHFYPFATSNFNCSKSSPKCDKQTIKTLIICLPAIPVSVILHQSLTPLVAMLLSCCCTSLNSRNPWRTFWRQIWGGN